MKVLLAMKDTFFRCRWCRAPFLTLIGCDAHESICGKRPGSKQ